MNPLPADHANSRFKPFLLANQITAIRIGIAV